MGKILYMLVVFYNGETYAIAKGLTIYECSAMAVIERQALRNVQEKQPHIRMEFRCVSPD